ncbi:MAG: hypothetical protein HY271_13425 [Deltaproteobacteria bacterium]|nr:hypothetical protein [Deltaproteobacteria bacterium]
MTHVPTSPRSGENRWDEAFPLLPVQHADLCRRSEPVQPERRLMLAVLSDAIVLFQTRGPQLTQRRDLEDAKRWILSDDRTWPFSFVNVCDTLGIAFEPLRRALLKGRRELPLPPHRAAARRRLLAGIVEPLARTG